MIQPRSHANELGRWDLTALGVPLAIFIIIGLAYVDTARLTTLPPVTLRQAGAAALLLIFIYGGYEVVAGAGRRGAESKARRPR